MLLTKKLITAIEGDIRVALKYVLTPGTAFSPRLYILLGNCTERDHPDIPSEVVYDFLQVFRVVLLRFLAEKHGCSEAVLRMIDGRVENDKKLFYLLHLKDSPDTQINFGENLWDGCFKR